MVSLNPDNEPEETMFNLASRPQTPNRAFLEDIRKFKTKHKLEIPAQKYYKSASSSTIPSPPVDHCKSPMQTKAKALKISSKVQLSGSSDTKYSENIVNIPRSFNPEDNASVPKINIAQKWSNSRANPKASQFNQFLHGIFTKSKISHAQMPSLSHVGILIISMYITALFCTLRVMITSFQLNICWCN